MEVLVHRKMKDSMRSCEHVLTDDVEYKEVVVIGNGPSGMVTSFMLDGNVPYLKQIPEDLPIDEMLRARLSNLPEGQSLYDADLAELAEGLEGRSQNPIPILMDALLRPCADLGVQADSLIEWRYESDKQIDHVVLGQGPPGGAWHTFPPDVRTLSPAAWLTLPPHTDGGAERLSARAVANYCRRYVHACKLQRYFRNGVVVTSVTLMPETGPPCEHRCCPRKAKFLVTGYEKASLRAVRYACSRAVVCAGGAARGVPLPRAAPHATHHAAALRRALRHPGLSPLPVLVVGSGVSAADGVLLCAAAARPVLHVHRAPAPALARLAPQLYPDYCQVYRLMCGERPGHASLPGYTSLPDHVILDVTPLSADRTGDADDEDLIRPKRVRLLDPRTDTTKEVTVSIIGAFIGSKPDLFFLQTNLNRDRIDIKAKCTCGRAADEAKRKIDDKQFFLKNHWHHLKSVVGQSLQNCRSRYFHHTELNGKRGAPAECGGEGRCCAAEALSDGIGFGIDRSKPVDCRANPLAIDKGTHELLAAPRGLYALGPVAADNFVRFVPGGALAAVAHMHRAERTNATL